MIVPPTPSRRLTPKTNGPSRQRGYTLVELMAVVAMVGILAALAVVGYRKWLNYARTAQTKDLVQGVMLAEKFYYDETRGYLGCSSSYTDYYPTAPNDHKHAFHDPANSQYACWKLLNAEPDGPVYVGIAVVAGGAGLTPPQPSTAKAFSWPSPSAPWYVVQATGDLDTDGDQSYFVGSSFSPNTIYVENEYE